MEYRQLGRSGLRVSTITLGTMGFGGTGWAAPVGQIDVDGARRQIGLARDAGVNLFDTADVYSGGTSRGDPRARRSAPIATTCCIATKVRMPMGDGPNDAGLSRHHIIRGAEASLRRLGTDYIDLYQVHEWDGQTPLEETLQRPRPPRPVGQGALHRLLQLRRLAADEGAVDLRRERLARFVSQQVYYSLQARDIEYELVPLASTRASASWSGARSPAACCRASTAAASRRRPAAGT